MVIAHLLHQAIKTPLLAKALNLGDVQFDSSRAASNAGAANQAVKAAVTLLILCAAGVASSQSCSGISLGANASLNGFVPFPSSNVWNTNISSAPVDPNSAAMTSASGFAGFHLHPDFGSESMYGIPYVVVDSTITPTVPIDVIDYADQSDVVAAPYPVTAPIEGSPADCSGWPDTYTGDAHVLVLDRAKCVLYETFNTNRCNGQWNASSETIWDMSNYESRPWSWTSADAAGLPIFPGLVRYDEIASGAIHHAIRFTMQQTKDDNNGGYFVYPASHAAGNLWGSMNVMGMRIRLKASFDISGFSPVNQIILTAMQQYGMILADNGGYFFFQGVSDPRFDDNDLDNLKSIASSNFEVVQSAPEFPGYDSETAPAGAAPTINSFTASSSNITSGSPVTFSYNVSGDSYDYIDVIGPVPAASGSVTVNPTATQIFKLNSTNAFGRTTSAPITITVPGSVVVPPVFTPPAGLYTTTQPVTLSSATSPSATIYYTTDGSTPTTSSMVFSISSPISVAPPETVKAIATATGYSAPSAVASAIYSYGASTSATPVFSLAAGTYNSAQNVTISDSTPGATIYYTTNGTPPTTGSSQYTGVIAVSACETIQAIAVAAGYTNSATAAATYTINLPAAAMPVFSLSAGTYNPPQLVTLSDITPGATIYYTTDGAPPTTSSTQYTGTISVSATETIQAIAVATGFSNSAAASVTYTISLPVAATPVFSLSAGTYTAPQAVFISDATPGATIYYTFNGSTPTVSSSQYTGQIAVSVNTTVKAIAVAAGYTNSATASSTYIINKPPAATPVFSVSAGTYNSPQSVTISDATPEAMIYYTTDGTTPTCNSTHYLSAIPVSRSQTIRAIAAARPNSLSAVASAAYTITPLPIAQAARAMPISASAATLNGTVNTSGLSGTYVFQYGTKVTAMSASTAPIRLGASAKAVAASAKLSGLKSKTTYSYRVAVTTAAGTANSATLSFTTN